MATTNGRRSGIRLVMVGLLAGLLLSVAHAADAQLIPPGDLQLVYMPYAPPDLVIAASAPAQIAQFNQDVVTITVDNTLTPVKSSFFGTVYGGSAVSGVGVYVLFSGLTPLSAQGNSGFQCQMLGSGGTVPPIGVWCSGGALGAGGTATISISVQVNNKDCNYYCGPVYTDARVDPWGAIAERSETNNRAIAVTDTINCIN